jgi:Cof subfamily protein (haloacid dehalogenase superfamily)
MAFRLIALDIDGTIREPDHPISERTRLALLAVREAGATVTIATGRSFRSAVAATRELDLDSPIASFQGAHLADPRTGEVLWHRPLTPELTTRALGALENNGDWDGDVMAFIGADVYVSRLTSWTAPYGDRQEVRMHEVGDLASIVDMKPTRLVAVGDHGRIEGLEADLIAHFGDEMHVTRSLPHFCEILHPDGGKHRALEVLGERLGITRQETLVFGNGYNDVHMLRWAGMGVAVAGGVPEAAEAADRVAPSVKDEGPAKVLEEFLDEGLIG